MKTLLSLFASILLLTFGLNAQVSIGNVVPDTNSILDLQNTNNRGLILPKAPGLLPTSPLGIVFFSDADSKIYYRESGGYNVLSPWRYKFNGASTNHTYYNFNGNVGIGLTDPQRKFHIKNNGEGFALEGSSSSFFRIYPQGFSGGHKASVGFLSTNTTKLTIQNHNSGADVEVVVSNGGALNVQGGTVQQNGADLVPRGTIVMWFGSTSNIPSGWADCNGTGGTPNMVGMFPRGASSTSFSSSSNGGKDNQTLTTANMPAHNHTVTGGVTVNSTGSAHVHSMNGDGGSTHSSGSKIRAEDDFSKLLYTRSGGAHTHGTSHNLSTASQGSGSSFDNKPAYRNVVFIMKL